MAKAPIMTSIVATAGHRVLARSIEADGRTTVVGGACPLGVPRQRRLAATPNLASARRWLHAMRRIDRVEIDGSHPTPRCVAHAVGHRLPVTQPVALATALGLAALGVPLLIELLHGEES